MAERHRQLTALSWVVVFLVSGFLEGDTVATMQRVGLFGTRPPLSVAHTVLRILIVIVALALLYVFHNVLERIALLIVAAAAGSTALHGFGLRSAGLSAFRLLSHLAAYALVMIVAGRMVAVARRELKSARAMAKRKSNGSPVAGPPEAQSLE
jgi:hypothetical protein